MPTMIGSLLVSLGLDSAQFSRGMTKAERDVSRARNRFSVAGAAMTGALVGIGSGLVMGALQNAIGGAFDLASAMSEAAARTGVSVEALQELRVAANASGVSNETLESSMGKLNVQLGALQNGVPKAVAAFAALGISAADLKNKSPDEALSIIADRIAKIADPTMKAAAAQAIFGKSYAQMLPLLQGGSAALAEAAEESRRHGQITTEEAQQLDDLADSWDAFKTRFMVSTAKIVASFADVSAGYDRYIAWTEKLHADYRAFAQRLEQLGANAAAAMRSVGSRIGEAVSGMVDRIVSTGKDIVAGLARGITSNASAVWNALRGVVQRGVDNVRSMLGIKSPSRVFMGIGGHIGDGLAIGIDGSRGKVESSLAGLFSAGTKGVVLGMGVPADFEEFTDAANDNADQVEIANDRVVASFDEAARSTMSAIDRMVGAIKGGSFLDILGAVVGLGMQLGSIGVFGKGIADRINAPATLPRRANGGPVDAGKRYLVGERGPELFDATRSGRIIPNSGLENAMGSGLRIEVVANNNGFGAIVRNYAGQVVAESAPGTAAMGAQMAGMQQARANSRRWG